MTNQKVTNDSCPIIDMIGYKIDISTQMFSISERNALRALYAFFQLTKKEQSRLGHWKLCHL